MNTRVLLVGALMTLLVVSAGCAKPIASNSTAPPAEPQAGGTTPDQAPSPLEFVETGFKVVTGPYVDWGFVLKNPNTAGAVSTTVRITMRDAAGVELGTEDVPVKRIMPGATVALGGERADPHLKVPAKVEFAVLDADTKWVPADQTQPDGFKPLTVTGPQASTRGMTTSFTGQLENPNGVAFKEVAVTTLLRDSSGKIVYGGYSIVEDVKADSATPYRGDVLGVGEYATFELIAQPW